MSLGDLINGLMQCKELSEFTMKLDKFDTNLLKLLKEKNRNGIKNEKCVKNGKNFNKTTTN